MIEFTLGMPAEEYIRKHKSLLNIAGDNIDGSRRRPLDVQHISDEVGYVLYYQVPTSHPVTLHAFVVSNRKSARLPSSTSDYFTDTEMLCETYNKIQMKLFLGVSFDTPIGKHIFLSLAYKTPYVGYIKSNYNMLLTPHFLETYQARAPKKAYGRNILHRFFLDEICWRTVGGKTSVFDENGFHSVRGEVDTSNGTSFYHLFGNYIHEAEGSDTADATGCVMQLNSFYPRSWNPKSRLSSEDKPISTDTNIISATLSLIK